MQWTKVLGLGLGAAAFLGLGIILGHFAIPKEASSPAPGPPVTGSPAPSISAPQDLDLQILETVMGQLNASRIRENLRELSREPHVATSPRDEDLVQLLLQRWRDPESGLDSAEASKYEVLLSFPSQEQPNLVHIGEVLPSLGNVPEGSQSGSCWASHDIATQPPTVGPTGDIIYSCRQTEENLTGEQGGPDVVQPYAAYAPAGAPQGLLVYANRGSEEDFKELQTQGIKLEGTIALTRYGGVGRGAKAVNAAKHGVAGVLVYTDPADINDGLSSPSETFPNSWYLPPSGVERGSYYEYFGDPLTPYLPAIPSSFRLDLANVSGFPPIPTQPIGFQDARDLLCNLDGTLAPTTWQGALGCSYRLGPGFRPDGDFPANSQVNVSVHNRLELRNSSNVLGIIRGAVEPGEPSCRSPRPRLLLCSECPCHCILIQPCPHYLHPSCPAHLSLFSGSLPFFLWPDRYVLYGNHRDSWVHGAVDPSSGTAVLLELSRVLGTLLKKGTWRPRRSIVFASWGAEEFGLIGSTEFTEEFFNKLQERTVAYINVDISVFANATLRVQGTPPVQSVVFSATKEVEVGGPSGAELAGAGQCGGRAARGGRGWEWYSTSAGAELRLQRAGEPRKDWTIRSPGPGDLSIYDNWIRYFNRSSPVYGLVPR
ncbi:Aminopeptidase naaladl1 [Saguinus oedipus]|uniref:Aminopeptidase naaladl1 n=1 Tax=Saguinus oedipus TaxID=9490 RepID=A0ABQ9UUN8_SAGOE|nr:Aminopeptidase naaladl1 [Saguinus oedipus]